MIAKLPHISTLASAYYGVVLLVEVVLLYGCIFFFAICHLLKRRHIHAPIGEGHLVPLVCEDVPIILAVAVVILDGVLAQLLHGCGRRQYLAGQLLNAQLLGGTQAHISTDDDVCVAVRIYQQLAQV